MPVLPAGARVISDVPIRDGEFLLRLRCLHCRSAGSAAQVNQHPAVGGVVLKAEDTTFTIHINAAPCLRRVAAAEIHGAEGHWLRTTAENVVACLAIQNNRITIFVILETDIKDNDRGYNRKGAGLLAGNCARRCERPVCFDVGWLDRHRLHITTLHTDNAAFHQMQRNRLLYTLKARQIYSHRRAFALKQCSLWRAQIHSDIAIVSRSVLVSFFELQLHWASDISWGSEYSLARRFGNQAKAAGNIFGILLEILNRGSIKAGIRAVAIERAADHNRPSRLSQCRK